MTANELCRDCGFTLLCCGDREVTGGVYCCDLLSMVMGRAPTDGVWFTVMANQNTIVAALMADVACVVLTEGIRPDEAMLARAAAENIAVATADCPSYAAARRADDADRGRDKGRAAGKSGPGTHFPEKSRQKRR